MTESWGGRPGLADGLPPMPRLGPWLVGPVKGGLPSPRVRGGTGSWPTMRRLGSFAGSGGTDRGAAMGRSGCTPFTTKGISCLGDLCSFGRTSVRPRSVRRTTPASAPADASAHPAGTDCHRPAVHAGREGRAGRMGWRVVISATRRCSFSEGFTGGNAGGYTVVYIVRSRSSSASWLISLAVASSALRSRSFITRPSQTSSRKYSRPRRSSAALARSSSPLTDPGDRPMTCAISATDNRSTYCSISASR
jgi:hypothetical protein